MCGRYSIYEPMDHYLKQLGSEHLVINGYDLSPLERYNVAPTTSVEIIRSTEEGLRVDKVRWGWSPSWAKGKRPDPINARVETVMTGKFFKELWPHGRALAPANGWFEWVADPNDPKRKQPYYIRLKSQAPMFFAALAEVQSELEAHERNGFVIITSANYSEMMDIHDRRPLVLSLSDAREWINPATTETEVKGLLTESQLQPHLFEWFKVAKAVGNVKNNGAWLISKSA